MSQRTHNTIKPSGTLQSICMGKLMIASAATWQGESPKPYSARQKKAQSMSVVNELNYMITVNFQRVRGSS